MPHVLVRGIPAEQLATLSTLLIEQLAEVCECGTDNFTLESVPTTGVFGGKVIAAFPFAEVYWFERGTEVRDRFADVLDRHLRSLGYSEVEIAFQAYREDSYYINGKRFNTLK
ncbi:DUF1904 family protein [Paenibacillus turpanensis]|uniref:DUF1904 family protein n=1 Tax=Paenibacillus turpanensis TaxID=2689078 RepID=UPI00140C10AE|nr:DUF1904 family protein [Paenibacillus turpanensis]